MKNSIKTLSLILLALLAANTSFATDYTYNGTFSPALPGGGLTSADSVIVTSGTWTLASNTSTVRGVNLQGGTLALGGRTLNGRVHVSGSSSITTSGGSINGTLATTAGTLTLGNNLTATRTNLKGGTLALSGFDLTGPVSVLVSSSISASSSNASIGALTVKSGTLTIVGSTFGISSLNMAGGNLSLASFILTISGSITISGTGTISGSGTGRIYTGSTTTVNGGTLTLDNVELTTENLTFSSANDINTINGGIFSFNNNDNSISGAAADRHINGTIRVYVDDNGKNSAIYPLGDGTVYAPVRLSSMNGINSSNNQLSNVNGNYGTHFFTLSYVGSINNNKTFDNTLVGASGHEYWNISTSNTNPAARITLYLTTSGSTYGKTRVASTTNLSNNLELAQFNSSNNNWTLLSASVSNVTGGVSVQSSSSLAPNTSFTFGSTNAQTSFLTPLPVSIIDFSARANDNNIEIKWSTASEKDNASFVVEKSLDGNTWSAIGTIKGAKSSNVVNNYGMVDFKAVAGFQYYRLKQIDLDGTVNYSKAIMVNFSKASTLNVTLFPNPAKDVLNLNTENNATGEVNVQILNSMGELVYNQTLIAGVSQSIDIASFNPGIYYVTVIAQGETKIIRLLKN